MSFKKFFLLLLPLFPLTLTLAEKPERPLFKKVGKGRSFQWQGDTNLDGKNDVIHFFRSEKGKSSLKYQTLRDSDFDQHFETRWIFPRDPGTLGRKEILDAEGNFQERTLFRFGHKKGGPEKRGIWTEFQKGPHHSKEKIIRYFNQIYNQGKVPIDGNERGDQHCQPSDEFSQTQKNFQVFSQEIKTIIINSTETKFFPSSYGYEIDLACEEAMGKNNLNNILERVFLGGLQCLKDLDTSRAREHLSNFQSITENKKSVPRIICSEISYDWKGTRGHASVNEKEPHHPFISLSPTEVKKGKMGLVEDISGVLFHEAFHNFGHFHGDGEPDYCYACSACCFKEEGGAEEVQKLGCDICRGSYPKGIRDPLYIKMMTEFFLKMNHTGPAQDILFQSLQQNPLQMEGVLALIKIYKSEEQTVLFGHALGQEIMKMKSHLETDKKLENLASSEKEISLLLGELEKNAKEITQRFPELQKSAETLGQAFFHLIRSHPEKAVGALLSWEIPEIDQGEGPDDLLNPVRQNAFREELFLGRMRKLLADKIFDQIAGLTEAMEMGREMDLDNNGNRKEILDQMMIILINLKENGLEEKERQLAWPFIEDYLSQGPFSKEDILKNSTRKTKYDQFMSLQ